MLKDSRVKVNEPDNDGETPLCYAARFGSPDVIKWWIASGREIELGEPGDVFMDAIGVAKEYDRTEVVSLLERLKENPVETRHAVRVVAENQSNWREGRGKEDKVLQYCETTAT